MTARYSDTKKAVNRITLYKGDCPSRSAGFVEISFPKFVAMMDSHLYISVLRRAP